MWVAHEFAGYQILDPLKVWHYEHEGRYAHSVISHRDTLTTPKEVGARIEEFVERYRQLNLKHFAVTVTNHLNDSTQLSLF